MTELRGRLLYDRYRRGMEGASEENLERIAAEREEECRRIREGGLFAVKVGREYRIPLSALAEFLDGR